ncbi:hypothetical protein [Streptomyces sp. NPDC053427]|uniref:hypothetical protein n=1 Tax=Streptomyces sp. NPDC053427 TaxID=3365701 RepID=UPI0037D920C0
MPPRTRKTTLDDTEVASSEAAAPEDATSDATTEPEMPEIAEDKAAPADTETKIPDVAPLEPPRTPEPIPERVPLTTAQQLLPAKMGDRIVDDATGEPPTDPEGVFIPVMPHGGSQRCTVRLVEHVGMGAYNTPTARLLVPIGAELRRDQAERVLARLRAQLSTSSDSE